MLNVTAQKNKDTKNKRQRKVFTLLSKGLYSNIDIKKLEI
jgi:hypothetical protein